MDGECSNLLTRKTDEPVTPVKVWQLLSPARLECQNFLFFFSSFLFFFSLSSTLLSLGVNPCSGLADWVETVCWVTKQAGEDSLKAGGSQDHHSFPHKGQPFCCWTATLSFSLFHGSNDFVQDELNQLPQPLRDKLPKDIFLTIGTENQKQNITAIAKTFSAEAFEEAFKDQEEDDATAQQVECSFTPFFFLSEFSYEGPQLILFPTC